MLHNPLRHNERSGSTLGKLSYPMAWRAAYGSANEEQSIRHSGNVYARYMDRNTMSQRANPVTHRHNNPTDHRRQETPFSSTDVFVELASQ